MKQGKLRLNGWGFFRLSKTFTALTYDEKIEIRNLRNEMF